MPYRPDGLQSLYEHQTVNGPPKGSPITIIINSKTGNVIAITSALARCDYHRHQTAFGPRVLFDLSKFFDLGLDAL